MSDITENLFIRFGVYDSSANRLAVFKNGAHVGDIRGVTYGWEYWPTYANSGEVPRVFTVLTKLKQYLRDNL
jgi:hypothetical protein